MRALGIFAALVALGGMAGTGSSTHSRSTRSLSNISMCGIPYVFSAADHAPVDSGSCAGLIFPASLAVRRGTRFSVKILHEKNGRFDFPVPTPSTTTIKILSRSGATVTYRAMSVSTARLVAHHTRFCAGLDPKIGSCTALLVRIKR